MCWYSLLYAPVRTLLALRHFDSDTPVSFATLCARWLSGHRGEPICARDLYRVGDVGGAVEPCLGRARVRASQLKDGMVGEQPVHVQSVDGGEKRRPENQCRENEHCRSRTIGGHGNRELIFGLISEVLREAGEGSTLLDSTGTLVSEYSSKISLKNVLLEHSAQD